ncbi:GyrI-like domain-containing protein [Jeotgalibaca sp. A122]|uniref:GyrI-like domain-containing protein n=1 Tax=Jeotgalibaca sp. A122 TaxID=3457322 RepID=UPI003FD07702
MPRISDWLVIERPQIASLVVRSTVPLKELKSEMAEAREKLIAYFNLIDAHPAGDFFVTYHSFSKKDVDMEAGYPTFERMAGEEEITTSEKVAGLYLSCIHQGPHNKIPHVYREMDEWLKENHFETTGESEEIYLNEGVQEELLLTQILIPILEDVNGERE